jgi:hypothetical protein
MRRRRSCVPGCALLALFILGAGVQGQPAPAAARAAAEKLAADLAAGKKISADDAKALAQRFNRVDELMSVYKPARKGQPHLEEVLRTLSARTAFTPAEKTTLTRIAHLSRAAVLLLPHHKEKIKDNLTRTRDWDRFTGEMAKGSIDLLDAIKAGEAQAISRAATHLAASCADCHGASSCWSSGEQRRPGKSSYEPTLPGPRTVRPKGR